MSTSPQLDLNCFLVFRHIGEYISISRFEFFFVAFRHIGEYISTARSEHCFLVFRRIGEYISVDLFCFVNLTSRCSLIPLNE